MIFFGSKRSKFEFLSSKSVIKLRGGESGVVDFVEINVNGDKIYYRGESNTHYFTFEIANYDHQSESMKYRLPSSDRLRSYSKSQLSFMSRITGIPLAELVEIRDLERSLNLARPSWR